MFRRQVKPLGEILQKLLRQEGLETPLLQKQLLDSWDKVVGTTISSYTEDKFIKGQTLFVKITKPALRSDLSMMKNKLVERLNNSIGTMLIVDISLF